MSTNQLSEKHKKGLNKLLDARELAAKGLIPSTIGECVIKCISTDKALSVESLLTALDSIKDENKKNGPSSTACD